MTDELLQEFNRLESDVSEMSDALGAVGDVIENEKNRFELQDKAMPVLRMIRKRLNEISEEVNTVRVHTEKEMSG